MRIAYYSVSDGLGGSETALISMIEGVRRHRSSWTLQVILPGRGPLLARAEAAGADCVVVPFPESLTRLGESTAPRGVVAGVRMGARLVPVAAALPSYLRRLRRAVRASRPAILHTNGIKAHVLGARVGPEVKVVWHLHEYVSPRRMSRALLRFSQPRVASILANSASVADDAATALAPTVPVHVIHNAVDLSTFAPDGPAEDLDARAGLARSAPSTVRVGLVATFARWKGHELFLRALAALGDRRAIRGYIIGGPQYTTEGSEYTEGELRGLARTLGVHDRVGFTGFLPAARAMRALDIVVHASTQPEPLGVVIAEAMACGRAVLTPATGGAAELVEPGSDALTYRSGDVESLSAGIARLSGDAGLRQRLGAQARVTACRLFNPDRLASQVVSVYEGLTADGSAARAGASLIGDKKE
jgi:glycosyltransferase involved in cell wall biosynthesis